MDLRLVFTFLTRLLERKHRLGSQLQGSCFNTTTTACTASLRHIHKTDIIAEMSAVSSAVSSAAASATPSSCATADFSKVHSPPPSLHQPSHKPHILTFSSSPLKTSPAPSAAPPGPSHPTPPPSSKHAANPRPSSPSTATADTTA